MQAFELTALIQQRATSGLPYMEFLRVPDLSVGLYHLPRHGTDAQMPHAEDEVYFVVSGRAKIRVGSEERALAAGSVVYVPKNVEHGFHSIEEALSVLVFFAPAEYTNNSC